MNKNREIGVQFDYKSVYGWLKCIFPKTFMKDSLECVFFHTNIIIATGITKSAAVAAATAARQQQ